MPIDKAGGKQASASFMSRQWGILQKVFYRIGFVWCTTTFIQGKEQTNVYTLHYITSGNGTFCREHLKIYPDDGSRSNCISLDFIYF